MKCKYDTGIAAVFQPILRAARRRCPGMTHRWAFQSLIFYYGVIVLPDMDSTNYKGKLACGGKHISWMFALKL